MIKVKEHNDLVRDPVSKAIINVDERGYETYLAKKEALKQKNRQIDKNSEDIVKLKDDISEIKEMLKMLIINSK